VSQFRLTTEAHADIREICDYIADDSPDAADRVLEDLYAAINLIAKSPRIGHSRPDLTKLPVLFWPVASYLVIYHRDLRPVHIVAVLHGKRNVKKLLVNRTLVATGRKG
jgi:plasmid stabilization system protein ParE